MRALLQKGTKVYYQSGEVTRSGHVVHDLSDRLWLEGEQGIAVIVSLGVISRKRPVEVKVLGKEGEICSVCQHSTKARITKRAATRPTLGSDPEYTLGQRLVITEDGSSLEGVFLASDGDRLCVVNDLGFHQEVSRVHTTGLPTGW
jgi:hypothetical protein